MVQRSSKRGMLMGPMWWNPPSYGWLALLENVNPPFASVVGYPDLIRGESQCFSNWPRSIISKMPAAGLCRTVQVVSRGPGHPAGARTRTPKRRALNDGS